ncbi:unnamed protein product [Pleuronectes platessa]|uniref:Uncharacterized protein n=1 Tax=Pleuronectes platessa TaxID=8262 RepID=A0A9N7W2Z1_PLEPL|nr:unnamed protein product [Pleuronectes platessa]
MFSGWRRVCGSPSQVEGGYRDRDTGTQVHRDTGDRDLVTQSQTQRQIRMQMERQMKRQTETQGTQTKTDMRKKNHICANDLNIRMLSLCEFEQTAELRHKSEMNLVPDDDDSSKQVFFHLCIVVEEEKRLGIRESQPIGDPWRAKHQCSLQEINLHTGLIDLSYIQKVSATLAASGLV